MSATPTKRLILYPALALSVTPEIPPMMPDPDPMVVAFARRTQANLDFLRQQQRTGAPVYEVTQLINSMLGLLIFPREEYLRYLPDRSLETLLAEGWPVPRIVGNPPQANNLREIVRLLRNAIAHCNLKLVADERNEISGLVLWNRRGTEETWRAHLTLEDLEEITQRFVALILDHYEQQQRYPPLQEPPL